KRYRMLAPKSLITSVSFIKTPETPSRTVKSKMPNGALPIACTRGLPSGTLKRIVRQGLPYSRSGCCADRSAQGYSRGMSTGRMKPLRQRRIFGKAVELVPAVDHRAEELRGLLGVVDGGVRLTPVPS